MGEATVRLTRGLHCRVDRGPNWLFIKLDKAHMATQSSAEADRWAEKMWEVCCRHFTYRLVVELCESGEVSAELTSALESLGERLTNCGGAIRVCGAGGRQPVAAPHFSVPFQVHNDRTEAVLGASSIAT